MSYPGEDTFLAISCVLTTLNITIAILNILANKTTTPNPPQKPGGTPTPTPNPPPPPPAPTVSQPTPPPTPRLLHGMLLPPLLRSSFDNRSKTLREKTERKIRDTVVLDVDRYEPAKCKYAQQR
ncbi:hypothetical protein B0T21DRAFT_390254 [Apiosordaria backusii]|uniref:Uncharacterized protein n=1 Tax=Apiosordaria backusii TaxID=314023 RepID=A0AA40K401_9PEZI|nr:hypothetical protein B0T21DRAFT_390254 [Apiosordaria backusii]